MTTRTNGRHAARRRDGLRSAAGARCCRAHVALVALLAVGSLAACESKVPPDTGRLATPQPGAVPIGVFSGSALPARVERFSRELGRPVDLVHDYLGRHSWSALTNVAHLSERWRDAGFAGRTVLTVPLLPDSGGSLARGAAGHYNKHFRRLARQLVASDQAAATLRLGPEFNGTWFPWTIDAPRGGRRYAAYWRQVVTTMRAVEGARFRFDWSANAGSSFVGDRGRQLSAASAYPGDRYVDYVGLDVFDQSWAEGTKDPEDRWRQLVRQHDGLNWHSRFAEAHGKPMTFPEWGLVSRPDGRGGGDNPYFVERMHDWIQSHPVAYHLYFESRDPNGDYRVFGGRFPRAAARFTSLFGSQDVAESARLASAPAPASR